MTARVLRHLRMEILLVQAAARLTAGLRWAPETGRKEWHRVIIARPGGEEMGSTRQEVKEKVGWER